MKHPAKFDVYDNKGKIEATGPTRHAAWKQFYEDINTFADNLTEFTQHCINRGYTCKKRKQ